LKGKLKINWEDPPNNRDTSWPDHNAATQHNPSSGGSSFTRTKSDIPPGKYLLPVIDLEKLLIISAKEAAPRAPASREDQFNDRYS
jgi:hypothetical protein